MLKKNPKKSKKSNFEKSFNNEAEQIIESVICS